MIHGVDTLKNSPQVFESSLRLRKKDIKREVVLSFYGGIMLTAIGDVMRRCYEKGWITTRDGNISMKKRDGKYLHITPSGWRKTIVHPEHVIRLEIVTDQETGLRVPKINEQQKPSGELWMHWNLQRDSHRTRTVVHVHATHVVAAIQSMRGSIYRLSALSFLKFRVIRESDSPVLPCRRCLASWPMQRRSA